jgi:hypothetical protein
VASIIEGDSSGPSQAIDGGEIPEHQMRSRSGDDVVIAEETQSSRIHRACAGQFSRRRPLLVGVGDRPDVQHMEGVATQQGPQRSRPAQAASAGLSAR